jgi:hypothetical protein
MAASLRRTANVAVAEKHTNGSRVARTLNGRGPISEHRGHDRRPAWKDVPGPLAAIASSAQHLRHESGRLGASLSFTQRVFADMQILDAYTTLAAFSDNNKRSDWRDEGSSF